MMQITLLSLQFLLIIPTIEGRELFRISDDGLGGFRQEDSSREVTLFNDLTRDSIANNFVIDVYCRCLFLKDLK